MSTLANATSVFKLIARLRRDITVSDAVNELKIPKSSASRTLSLMAEHGFLERDGTTRAYRPGPVIMEASYHFKASRSTPSLLEAALESLACDTGYTGYVNVLDQADAMVIQMRTGTGSLQVYTPPGARAPAHATSMGRAILSRLADRQVLELCANALGKAHGNAPRTKKDLLQRLAVIRETGWALSRGEYVPNVAGMSAAVIDPFSGQVFGIGVALPLQDLSEPLIKRIGRRVRDAAMGVGKQIGDDYWLAASFADGGSDRGRV